MKAFRKTEGAFIENTSFADPEFRHQLSYAHFQFNSIQLNSIRFDSIQFNCDEITGTIIRDKINY